MNRFFPMSSQTSIWDPVIYKKFYTFLILFFMSHDQLLSSPLSVDQGGTGLTSIATGGLICGGTTTLSALQVVVPGTAGQGFISSGSSALPVVQNILPGKNATNFGYAGTTSNPSNSPSTVMVMNTFPNATLASSATNCVSLGYQALNNIVASLTHCTAIGTGALANITTSAASSCTAVGHNALNANNTGANNIAVGVNSLQSNVSGSENVCVGNYTCVNATGSSTTAIGHQALNALTTGSSNTAMGYQAGLLIQDGSTNVAFGYQALASNVSGSDNTAIGYQALNLATGSQNTAVGSGAGATATTGSNNIYIGYNAAPIAVDESNNIVIGNSSHTSCYMDGIFNVVVAGGVEVFINSAGKLGTTTSSIKYKENIEKVDKATVLKLLDIQPVKFNYNDDLNNKIEYGMIAEQVLPFYPETIVYDSNNQIQSIQYNKFVPLVIKHLQIKQEEIDALELLINKLESQILLLQNE